MFACAFSGTAIAQSGGEQAGSGGVPPTKVSVYDRDALSILIDAPAGVKLEVQGSADLVDWKRLAELMAGDKPLIWNPPSTLQGPNHFFRVMPMGGPDEALDGGDTEDGDGGGGENPGGPDVEEPNPNDPFDPGFPGDDGPMVGFKEIDLDSELAKALAMQLLAGVEGKELELVEVEEAAELSFEEEGAIYFITVLAKDSAGNEFVVSGELMVGDDGERKLDYTEVGALIDPGSDLAKRLAGIVMESVKNKGFELIELNEIVAVEKYSDEEGEFYFVHLEAVNGEGDTVDVVGEVAANEQGELKLIHADAFDGDNPFGPGDPFDPNDPDDGIDAIEHVDPESELGKTLIKAALAHVEPEGFESVEVVSVDRFNDDEHEMFGVVLLAKADGHAVTLFVGLEKDADGNFKVHEVEDGPGDPFDPNDPDGGMGDVEPIDPESELGQALVKAAVAQLEDVGLKLVEIVAMDRVKFDDREFIELVLLAKDDEGHEMMVFAEAVKTDDGGFDVLDVDLGPNDPDGPGIIDPGFGGETEELDSESDLVQKLVAIALEHADAEGLELDQVTGALRLGFGPDETVYLIDFLVKNSDGEVQKGFAEIMETEDGQYKVRHVGIGGDGNWQWPGPGPEPHGIIVPPEGSRSHFIDPQGDLSSALVTIVHLTIGDHVNTPWEIEHVEEAVRWHVPGEGSWLVLLAKGADANGKSGHLLAVLMRKDSSLTIELADVRVGINLDEPIKFPLPPDGGE